MTKPVGVDWPPEDQDNATIDARRRRSRVWGRQWGQWGEEMENGWSDFFFGWQILYDIINYYYFVCFCLFKGSIYWDFIAISFYPKLFLYKVWFI